MQSYPLNGRQLDEDSGVLGGGVANEARLDLGMAKETFLIQSYILKKT